MTVYDDDDEYEMELLIIAFVCVFLKCSSKCSLTDWSIISLCLLLSRTPINGGDITIICSSIVIIHVNYS